MFGIYRSPLLSGLAALSLLTGIASTAQAFSPPPFVPGRLLVRFKPDASAEQVRSLVASANAQEKGTLAQLGVHVLNLPAAVSETALARAFAQRPEVAFAEVDKIRLPQDVTPNDPYYANWQAQLRQISCPAAWSVTTGSSSVIIAILDSGVDASHPDLGSKLVPGWNTYSNSSDTSDSGGHGSKVAGTAAASSNNGSGIASVAWGCKIMPIKVTDASGNATDSSIASGLTWAADHGARVANISYLVADSATVSSGAQYFFNKAGVVTISAGNYSTFDSAPDNPYELLVTAIDPNNVLETYSNSGNNVDLCAPGTSMTTISGGTYGSAGGTSIAAPYAAGVAALVLSANPNLTAQQVSNILKQSADDLGAAGWDPQYGWGRLNAASAVNMALTTSSADTTPPTVSFASPSNGAAVSGTASIQINAGDNIAVHSVTFAVDGTALATAAAAPYTFTWDTTSVANGTHTLTATATDTSGNTASAQISVSVSNGGTADTTPPVCAITSPTGGKAGNSLTVSASASDNIGVVRVELWVDGKLSLTDTAPAWSFSVNSRKWTTGSHSLQCKAYDAAGNVGLSQIVTVTK